MHLTLAVFGIPGELTLNSCVPLAYLLCIYVEHISTGGCPKSSCIQHETPPHILNIQKYCWLSDLFLYTSGLRVVCGTFWGAFGRSQSVKEKSVTQAMMNITTESRKAMITMCRYFVFLTGPYGAGWDRLYGLTHAQPVLTISCL